MKTNDTFSKEPAQASNKVEINLEVGPNLKEVLEQAISYCNPTDIPQIIEKVLSVPAEVIAEQNKG